MPINHNFVSPVVDEHNPNEVGPDEWNDSHTLPAHGELSGLAADDHPQYALDSSSFVTMAADARLTNERILTGSASVNVADGGAGAAVTLSVLPGGIDHNSLLNLTVGDPHTQYTRKDVLTTTGDLYYAAAASTPNRLALTAPAANVRNVLGVDNGDTIPAWKTALDATAPTTIAAGAAAAAGISLVFSHRDHTHGAPATYPPTAHALLDGSVNNDTVAHAPVRGDIVIGNATPAWTGLAIGAAGAVLWTAGTDATWTINPLIAGYGRVGSASAPTNTTAGDITAVRAILGADVNLGASTPGSTSYVGARLAVTVASHVPPASADDPFMVVATYADDGTGGNNARTVLYVEDYVAPSANTGGQYRGVEANVFHDTGAFSVAHMTGFDTNIRHSAASTVAEINGVDVALIFSTSTSASATLAIGVKSELIGAGGGTIATLSHFSVSITSLPTAVTTHRGLNVPNLGGSGVGTAIGVDIAAQSGATTNFDIRGAGNSVFGGYLRVGAVTAPSNTTAGDLSAVRALVGTDAAITNNAILFINKASHVPPVAAEDLLFINAILAPDSTGAGNDRSAFAGNLALRPTAADTAAFRGINFTLNHDSGAFLLSSLSGLIVNILQGAGSAGNITGVNPAITVTSGAVTTVRGFRSSMTLTGGGAMTDVDHFSIGIGGLPSSIGNHIGVLIPNLGSAAVTTAVGVDIAAQSGATTNFDIRGAGNSVFGGYLRVGAVTAPSNTTAGDLSAVRLMVGSDAAIPTGGAVLVLNQGTLGNEVMRITSVAPNDDPTETVLQNRVATTDATVTTLQSVTIPATTTVFISATVVARRTGGVSGTAEDGAAFVVEAAVKNVAGAATLIGAVLALSTMRDQVLWAATITVTGATALLQVTGALANNVTWHATIRTWRVGT